MNKGMIDKLSVPIVIILGKVFVFIFDAMLVSYYGAGSYSDAFIFAHSLPTVLFDGISNAIIVCFIPVFQRIDNKSELVEYYNNTLSIAALIGVLFALILFCWGKPIIRIYAKGFNDETFEMLFKLSMIAIWAIPFISGFSVFRAYLQSNGARALSNIFQIFTYLFLIVTLIFFNSNIFTLAYATVLGNAATFFLLFAFCVRRGWKYKLIFRYKDENVKKLLIAIVPVFLSSILGEINAIVDKYFSSFYSAGIVTDMSYGHKLSFSLQGIIASSIMIVLYPTLSFYAAKGDYIGLKRKSVLAVKIVSYIMFPLVVGGGLCSYEIIKCVYGHGNFNEESVVITAEIFKLYLLGVIPMSVKHIGDKLCYAIQKTSFTFYSSLICVVVNVILNFVLSRRYGYYGLIYATVFSILLGCICVLVFLFHCNGKLVNKDYFLSMRSPFFMSLAMALFVILIEKYFVSLYNFETFAILLIKMISGMLFYGVLLCVFGREDCKMLFSEIKEE